LTIHTSHNQNMHISAYVIKGESFSFAYGGCADVWKGKWKDGTGNQMLAVKVPRGTIADKPAKVILSLSRAAHPRIPPTSD